MKIQDLNPKQKEAAEYGSGPLLIVAGAGSGKTKTLTSRLMNLLKNGADPKSIIAITFTNKAAQEMRDRISNFQLPISNFQNLFIGTFHSLGAKILRKEGRFFKRTAGFTIYDSDDSLRVIKGIVKNFNLDSKKYSAPQLQRKFSAIKSELIDLDDYFGGEYDTTIKALFNEYELALKNNNAFDFDDLIEKVVRVFRESQPVLKKYQKDIKYVLVDEYQDINTAQYHFVRLLAQSHNNISVVGDDQQCVLPGTKIITASGTKKIEKLTLKDKVIAAVGDGRVSSTPIEKIKKFKYSGPLVKIITKKGKILRLTPNHLIFSRLQLSPDIFFVYLMYRKDKGFRIGIAKGARVGARGEMQIGLITRNNQEKADKIWILKICSDRNEAEYFEFYYAFKYGIPTVVFDTNNRSMKLTQNHIDLLYQNIDTKKRGLELMKEELLYFEHPHWIPQGTIRHSSRRLRIRLAMFDNRNHGLLNPWGMSRLSVNTKELRLKRKIEKLGFKTRKGKLSDWRFEKTSMSYAKLENIAEEFRKLDLEIEVVRSACLTKNKRLYFQPAAHIRPTMLIAVKNKKGKIVEDVVIRVERENYNGLVYDLDISNTHNYIADGVVVHNSIYGFRFSDFRNFLNFDRDWPDAKVVFLEQNYRSTGNIIKAASAVVSNNKHQKPKTLWTENNDGELVKIIEHDNADYEAQYISTLINSKLNFSPDAPESIGILYRTNSQSRAIEQSLIENEIKYKIFGGVRFYERKEIKDIVAGLRYGLNPNDSVSLERLEKNFNKKIFLELKENLPKKAASVSALEIIGYIIKISDYFGYLERNYLNFKERRENLEELMSFASTFKNLGEFLERVSLLGPLDNSDFGQSADVKVNLMTIHLAKGLEFDEVFVIGCNEGLLPHHMSYSAEEEIEEERRLMYVAMTRAKQNLYLNFYDLPSRFLYEIPPQFVEFVGGQPLDDEERYIEI